MTKMVYINGEYHEKEDAKISIFDRGFIFGDGVYEVVPVINSRMADQQYFLDRLKRSLNELQINFHFLDSDLISVLNKLIGLNQLIEGVVYLQITRGIADRDFIFPEDTPPSIVAFVMDIPLIGTKESSEGISVVSTTDLRWKRRDIKSINLLGQCLAKQDAHSRNGKEGWMVEDGYVTEGVSSSAYIIKDRRIITRPLSNKILPGVRRRTLLEMQSNEEFEIEERLFTLQEAIAADEAFITSATQIVVPVIRIDGQQIADGEPGIITKKLRQLYINKLIQETSDQ
ncbi:D-amino-acid transaminase [Gammaproteobacteria bacterium]|nr:D-amino-acid transaminase [Gammaproteobacteria bacterium]MDB2444782.1 D-amino-acid transaminase [Gammaproteobacteria bacterium]